MKKILMGFGFVAAIGGALLTQSFRPVDKPNISLFKPGTCETRQCLTTTESILCTDLTITCNGVKYTGNLTRSIP